MTAADVRGKRKKLKILQKDLAAALDINWGTLIDIENGSVPTTEEKLLEIDAAIDKLYQARGAALAPAV